ncbi:MAG: hypothetical protein K2K85_05235 [Clostridia bacterium]|nr:hypothetical protein [Clostridia bacterium]
MRKKKYVTVLICILLALCVFAVACDGNGGNGQDGEERLVLEYLDQNNIILWKSSWAEKLTLIVYFGENTDGTVIYNESDISATENHRRLGGYFTQSGKYFVVLFAFNGGEVERQTLVIDVFVDPILQEPDDDYLDPGESDEVEGFKRDIGRLKSVYYHIAKSRDDMSIILANQNGIKSVNGFTLSQYGDWSYDQESNALIISGVYLRKFSAGARLSFEVEYNDGKDDKINVQLVDELPMDVIKGGLINSPIYSNNTNGVITLLNLAINYDIYLGYDGNVASESSINYVKDISIDGKRLLSSAYVCYRSSRITLTANKSLSGLSYGMHLLEIFTTHGKSEVWLNVKGTNSYPINVTVDYDNSYPDIFVRWDMLRDDAEEFVVKIGDNEYSSKDYPNLFDGYKFNATGKIAYGDEVRVTAVIDGRGEMSLGVTLNVDISNQSIQRYLSYNDSFEYLGTRYNTFIDDYDELKDLIFYSLIHYNDLKPSTDSGFEKMWRIYVNPSLASNATGLETKIRSAVEYFNEGVKDSWCVKGGYINIYEVHLTIYSTCIPDNVVRSSSIKENPFNDTHFSSVGRSSNFDGFAVNALQETAEVTYSEELYRALERGVRPIPKQGSPAQTVYEKAKTILRTIIDDGMTDFQKVHAIADWLSAYVTYNWALSDELNAASSTSDDYNKYYAYRELYLEGAILDGLAVCNGYAKAVSLLCGIEGIPCYKIKGASGDGSGVAANRVYAQHAWNKVYIDGSWYVLDSTWANEKYTYGSSQTREVLKHNTLFMTEEQSGNQKDGAHYEIYLGDYSGYFAGSPYDVFANTFFKYGGNIYDMVIDNESELEILLKYVANTKGRTMVQGSYITVDVRCDNLLLKQYVDALKNNGLELFANYSVDIKYYQSYGNMTSLVIWKK